MQPSKDISGRGTERKRKHELLASHLPGQEASVRSQFSSWQHNAHLASDGDGAAFTLPLLVNLAHGRRGTAGSAAVINGVGTEQQLQQRFLDGTLGGTVGGDSLLEEIITREQERLNKMKHEINYSTDRAMLSSLLQNANRSWFNTSGVVDLDGSLRSNLRLPTHNMEGHRLQSLLFYRNLSRAMPSHPAGLGRDLVLAASQESTIAPVPSSLVAPCTGIFHQAHVKSLPQRTSASSSIITLAASIARTGAEVLCRHQWHREMRSPLRFESLSRTSTAFDPAYLASVLLAHSQPPPPKKHETGNTASTPLVVFAGCRQGITSEGSAIRQPSVGRTVVHPGKATTASDKHTVGKSPIYDSAFGQEKRKVSSLVATEVSVLKDIKGKSLLPGDILERQPPKPFARTYRPPICLSIPTDAGTLSPYQCFLRQQIECFEANSDDVNTKAQGRNTPIVVGQIGIRCVHCAKMPVYVRISGSSFYSQSLAGIYQIAQNMHKTHFLTRCSEIPEPVRGTLARLQQDLKRGSGGKSYWKSAAEQLGIFEEDGVLKFSPNIPKPMRDASSDASKFVFN